MKETDAKVKLFGRRGSAEAHLIRDFLHRCDVPFEWIELNNDAQAPPEAQPVSYTHLTLPTILRV